ncbi:MAG TPA: nucleoside hydrolase [Chthonomonadales bacterium]|nr:nucleoside hydrolase [Chthonomonadales bacterium]
MDRIRLLLDTDIGSDIDDAIALAYLLRQPQCDLVGITTVSGEPEKRAALAHALCIAAGRPDVPVHVGSSAPFLAQQRQPLSPQSAVLSGDWPHARFESTNTAVAYLQETIRANPLELSLLAIGPLTNIGLLFALDPEIPLLLKQLVIMGGRYLPPAAGAVREEWNVLCDPHSAARVFRSMDRRLTAVGLDVTERCRLDGADCRRRFHEIGGPMRLVAAMAEVWLHDRPEVIFHDPLAAAIIFKDDLCRFQAGSISVDPCSDSSATTRFLEGEGGHRAATAVDDAAFLDHYFGVVGREIGGTMST